MIKFGARLTKEQFDKVWFGGKCQAFYPLECDAIVQVYNELSDNGACSNCSASVQEALDAIIDLRKDVEAEYLQPAPEPVIETPVIETKTSTRDCKGRFVKKC